MPQPLPHLLEGRAGILQSRRTRQGGPPADLPESLELLIASLIGSIFRKPLLDPGDLLRRRLTQQVFD
jgi:hypothetical protein